MASDVRDAPRLSDKRQLICKFILGCQVHCTLYNIKVLHIVDMGTMKVYLKQINPNTFYLIDIN